MVRVVAALLVFGLLTGVAIAGESDQALLVGLDWRVSIPEAATKDKLSAISSKVWNAGLTPMVLNLGNGYFTFELFDGSFRETDETGANELLKKLTASDLKSGKALTISTAVSPRSLLDSYMDDDHTANKDELENLIPQLRYGVWVGDVNANDAGLLGKLRAEGFQPEPAGDKFAICPAIFVGQYAEEFEARLVRDHLSELGFRMPLVALNLPEPADFHYTEANSVELRRMASRLHEQRIHSDQNSFTQSLPDDFELQNLVYQDMDARFPVQVSFVFAGQYDSSAEAEKAGNIEIGGQKFEVVSLDDDGHWQLFARAFVNDAEASQYVTRLKEWGFPGAFAEGTELGHRDPEKLLTR